MSEEAKKAVESVMHDYDILAYILNRLWHGGHAELAAAIEFAVPRPAYDSPECDPGFSVIYDGARISGAVMIGMRMVGIHDYQELLKQYERDRSVSQN